MKDCTTCKYGYEDERLGIPMCHHPKRFSEDCVDFNMHEEKETKESEKPVPNDLEEAAKEYTDNKSWAKENYLTPYIREAFIAGYKLAMEQGETIEGTLGFGPHLQRPIIMLEGVPKFYEGSCQQVIVQIRKKDETEG